MKHLVVIFVTLTCVLNFSVAQTYNFSLKATAVKKYLNYSKGTELNIVGLEHKTVRDPYYSSEIVLLDKYTMLLQDGTVMPLTTRIDKALLFDIQTIDDLWNATILQDVIPSLIQNGTQVSLRSDADQEAIKYLSSLENNGMKFNDPYLENYLYTLIAKMAPTTLIDGRPGNINLMIENNPNANASTYPNGTIVINTGLLSTLHTEDELVACLAHEVAHFVLDHHIININTEIKRQKAAAAAAAFATVVAAVAEGAATYYSNGYYMPGAVTAATAIGATAIANEIVTSLGMEYTQQQEFEADRYALQVVKFLGYDTTALASALTRLEHIMINERSNSMYLSSESHPALVDRINAAGKANLKRDINYERMVSFAITNSAYTKMDYRRFREAMVGVSQNIENNVATADDYLIKANCLLALKNDVSSNIEVLNLINKAKELQPNNINIHKAEILAELRLNNLASACEKLNTYSSYLDIMDEELPMIKNEELWKVRYYFTMHEREWVEKMLIKLKSMQF